MVDQSNIQYQRFLPPYRLPIVDANGICERTWYKFFHDLHRALGDDGKLVLSASQITGVLPAANLPPTTVYKDANGQIPIACIPNIPAANITGILTTAQLPANTVYATGPGGTILPGQLPANLGYVDAVTGWFPLSIIPDIPASKLIP